MKNQVLEDAYNDNPLCLNEHAKRDLLSIASSAFVISSFGMVATILLLILSLALFANELKHGKFTDLNIRPLFLLGAVGFVFAILINQFGTKAKKAIATQNAALLTESFKKIKWIAQLTGIAATLVVSLYAILMVASWLKLV